MYKKRPFLYFMNKSRLAQLYGVSTKTFVSWLRRNEPLYDHLLFLQYVETDKVFTPKQIELIFEFIGPPSPEYEIPENKREYVPIRSYTKSEVQSFYRTTHTTFNRILQRYPEARQMWYESITSKYYTALQVKLIFDLLGRPFYLKENRNTQFSAQIDI